MASVEVAAEVEKLALELWREREMAFPAFCRRMTPDDIDRETGAWAGMMQRAAAMTMGGVPAANVVNLQR